MFLNDEFVKLLVNFRQSSMADKYDWLYILIVAYDDVRGYDKYIISGSDRVLGYATMANAPLLSTGIEPTVKNDHSSILQEKMDSMTRMVKVTFLNNRPDVE